MRTIEISEPAYERAERAAKDRGISISEYMDRMLLSAPESGSNASVGKRVQFPIIPATGKGPINLTNEDIRRMEEEDDLRKMGLIE